MHAIHQILRLCARRAHINLETDEVLDLAEAHLRFRQAEELQMHEATPDGERLAPCAAPRRGL